MTNLPVTRATPTSGGQIARQGRARTERVMVPLLQAQGLSARKVSATYKRGQDLDVMVDDVERSDKCRAAGFHQLYDWLDQRDVLIVKADRQEPSVVLRMSPAAEIAKGTLA